MVPETVSFAPRGMPGIRIEGRLLDGGGEPLVVSHPHPLAGGTMDHGVVVALWRAAAARGYRALRYNFRGVGESEGELTAKSPLATADLGGAIDFLGGGPMRAIGYSYGARCTLHAIHDGEKITRAALVGLPTRLPINRAAMSNLLLGRRVKTEEFVDTPDLDLLADVPKPVRVFAGENDPLVVSEELEARGIEPVLLPRVNHFFSRHRGNQPPYPDDLDLLAERVFEFL
ncbi:MAG: alpha/beta hydrolase [Planctomycetota bacterium]|jgi:alpha/beta superfamily hydrolase